MSRSRGTLISSSRLEELLGTSAMERLRADVQNEDARNLPPGKWSAIIFPTERHTGEPRVFVIFDQDTMLMNGLGRWCDRVDQYQFLVDHPRVLDAKRRAKEAGLDFIEIDLTIVG